MKSPEAGKGGSERQHILTKKNVIRGWRYLQKNGFRKLLRRLKKGDHMFGIPYETWYMNQKATEEELEQQRSHVFEYAPKISVIVPTYRTPISFLREMVDSVCQQTYSNWELFIADGSEGNPELESVLKDYAGKDSRIRIRFLDKNYGLSLIHI